MQMIKASIPEGVSGSWRVERFTLTEEQLRHDFRNRMEGRGATPGTYTKLIRNGTIVMSDTPAELSDLMPVILHATGDVLVHGLGIGCVVDQLFSMPTVKSVTVIELSPDVIKLSGPTLSTKYGDRLKIVEADAFSWKPKGARFEYVWSDIWDYICEDNLIEMETLRKMWVRRVKRHEFWCRIECLRAKRRYSYA